jgi:hypothetical protein
MPIIACKLPHGLTIKHQGHTINLNGTNADFNPLAPSANGAIGESPNLSAGFGLTTLSDEQAAVFEDYRKKAIYVDGQESKGKLEEAFQPFVNGSIELFKSMTDARKETVAITSDVNSGFDGLDGDAEIKEAAAAANPNLVESGGSSKAK